jgi:glucose/arabinose dehydrogenase
MSRNNLYHTVHRTIGRLAAGLSLGALAVQAQTYVKAFDTLSFNHPLQMEEVPGKPGHFMVLEQPGYLQAVSRVNGAWTKSECVKITVVYGSYQATEDGLLGFAFHPQYATNRKYYLYYAGGTSTSRRDILEERVADSTLLKDSGTPPKVILSVYDYADNHNGGTVRFGKDGFLYLAIGDGGGLNDPRKTAQNLDSLLGKMLRIDVDRQENGKTYGIPADNPFAAGGGKPEIYAWGLRNPYRWAFDPVTGDLWEADVGESTWEEVNIIRKGKNYGWSVSEGRNGLTADITPPIFQYGHKKSVDSTLYGTAIVGGYVYRGNPASKFYGHYLIADNGSDLVWAVARTSDTSATVTHLAKAPDEPRGWGTDLAGNLYLIVGTNGIYRLTGPDFDASASAFLPRRGNLARSVGRVFSGRPGSKLDAAAFGGEARLGIFGLAGESLGSVGRDGPLPGLQRGMFILKAPSGARPHLLLVH